MSIDWDEWKLTWEPAGIPYDAFTKIWHTAEAGKFNVVSPPNKNWMFTMSGAQLIGGKWIFARKR
jgi:hypothetical protein